MCENGRFPWTSRSTSVRPPLVCSEWRGLHWKNTRHGLPSSFPTLLKRRIVVRLFLGTTHRASIWKTVDFCICHLCPNVTTAHWKQLFSMYPYKDQHFQLQEFLHKSKSCSLQQRHFSFIKGFDEKCRHGKQLCDRKRMHPVQKETKFLLLKGSVQSPIHRRTPIIWNLCSLTRNTLHACPCQGTTAYTQCSRCFGNARLTITSVGKQGSQLWTKFQKAIS